MSANEWVLLRIKLQDAAKFIAEAKASGAAIREVGRSGTQTAGVFDRLSNRSFWTQQALFTMRRVVYSLTLAFIALGGAAVAMGFQFNSMVEQQQLAFQRFTGSVQGANKEISFLFNLAAHGPFQFAQVIQASRQLQAFGFTVQDANKVLVALQDAMAGMGLDQAALDRATLALGQIRSTGKLVGQDLRQLEQLGLVSPEDLARRLGLSQAAIMQPGQQMIPSKMAIDAIMAYWQTRFHGAAAQFQKTWVGELSTLHDIGAQTFGTMVLPLQHRLERTTIPLLTRVAQAGQTGFKRGGMQGFFDALDKTLGQGTDLGRTWSNIARIGHGLVNIVETLGVAFFGAWRIVKPGLLLLTPLSYLLLAVGNLFRYLRWPLTVVIALFLAEKVALVVTTLALRRFFIMETLVWIRTRALSTAQSFALIAMYAWEGATKAATAAQWLLNIAMDANPIGLVVLAVAALVVIIVLLVTHLGWVRKHWELVLAGGLALLGPFGLIAGAILLIVRHFKTLVHWAGLVFGIFGKLKHAFGWAKHLGGSIIHGAAGLLGFAQGGTTPYTGMFKVGERGPEIVALPGGSTVTPLREPVPLGRVAGLGSSPDRRTLELRIPLYVDGRQLAEATARYELDSEARQ